MSELTHAKRPRRRRADAERSIAVILDAAVRILNERPEASIGEIANAAGVTRPTVYAHYPSREALLTAVMDRVTEEYLAALDAADLDHGPPIAALRRALDVGWHTVERYLPILRTAARYLDLHAEHDRHRPVQQRLERLIVRGQNSGDLDHQQSPAWLAVVIIGLGHTAGEQVAAGELTAEQAKTAYLDTTLRALGVTQDDL